MQRNYLHFLIIGLSILLPKVCLSGPSPCTIELLRLSKTGVIFAPNAWLEEGLYGETPWTNLSTSRPPSRSQNSERIFILGKHGRALKAQAQSTDGSIIFSDPLGEKFSIQFNPRNSTSTKDQPVSIEPIDFRANSSDFSDSEIREQFKEITQAEILEEARKRARSQLSQNPSYRNVSAEAKKVYIQRTTHANEVWIEKYLAGQPLTTADLLKINGLVTLNQNAEPYLAYLFDQESPHANENGVFSLLRGQQVSVEGLRNGNTGLNLTAAPAVARFSFLESKDFLDWEYPYKPGTVEPALVDLLQQINQLNTENELADVVLLFRQFRLIHPMPDGNSKTSYVLLDAMLHKIGMPPLPNTFEEARAVMFLSAEETEHNFRRDYTNQYAPERFE